MALKLFVVVLVLLIVPVMILFVPQIHFVPSAPTPHIPDTFVYNLEFGKFYRLVHEILPQVGAKFWSSPVGAKIWSPPVGAKILSPPSRGEYLVTFE